jgi:hypothetical protein
MGLKQKGKFKKKATGEGLWLVDQLTLTRTASLALAAGYGVAGI